MLRVVVDIEDRPATETSHGERAVQCHAAWVSPNDGAVVPCHDVGMKLIALEMGRRVLCDQTAVLPPQSSQISVARGLVDSSGKRIV